MIPQDRGAGLAPAAGAGDDAEQAWQDAQSAAHRAGVTVREITELGEIEAVGALYGRIWVGGATAAISNGLLRAFSKAGNYVAGAFDGATLVGACVGFFAAPSDGSLHSHIAGVSPSARGRDVGYALKLHQRGWAMRRGVRVIAWTYDPLVSRNAHFNIVKLAARPVEYLPNFYGSMQDGINDGDDSDRLLVRWLLDAPDVVAGCGGRPSRPGPPAGAVVALGASLSGAPVPGPLDAAVSLVAVPRDVEALRRTEPELARQWRAAVRATLTALLADGAVVAGFDRSGSYVLRRDPAAPAPAPLTGDPS